MSSDFGRYTGPIINLRKADIATAAPTAKPVSSEMSSVWVVATTVPHEFTEVNGVCSSPGLAAELALKCEREYAHLGDAIVRVQEWLVR